LVEDSPVEPFGVALASVDRLPTEHSSLTSSPPTVGQESAPYLDALLAYARSDPRRLHVPGHKGGRGADELLLEAVGTGTLGIDIPASIHGIDLGPDPTPLQEALRLAAEAWGARRSWFLVNGASEGCVGACLTLAQSGSRVVVQRNVHVSTIHGIVLAGLHPTFVAPEIDTRLEIAHAPTPEALDRALAAAPAAVGVIVVSPTYFGAVADIRGLAAVTRRRGVALVVDEAWGAHLRFHEDLPEDAVTAGADLVISGTHKVVGSLTQSAMLHLGHAAGPLLDEGTISRVLSLIESTSPSALLIASLDTARRQVATEGRALLGRTLEQVHWVRERLRALPGLAVMDEAIAGAPGVHGFDPLRLVVDVCGLGLPNGGYELAARMRRLSEVHLELVTETVVVPHFGIADGHSLVGEELVSAFSRAIESTSSAPSPLPPRRRFARPPGYGPLVMPPRSAFFASQRQVEIADAVGTVAAESLSIYPPGIPVTIPGEQLTPATVRYIQRTLRQGGTLRTIGGRTPDRLTVVAPEKGGGTVAAPRCGDLGFEQFPARAYLDKYYAGIGPENAAMARAILDYLGRHEPATDTVIEVGGGPSLLGMMALAAHRRRPFRRVTFTDLAPQNLSEVRAWLEGRPESFDHRHALRWLEHETESSQEEVTDVLRRSAWELEETDWRQPARDDWLGSFDVVASHFFAESVTRDMDEFRRLLGELGRLARPGGCVLLSLLEGSTGYPVDGVRFPAVPLDARTLPAELKRAGLLLEDLALMTVAAEEPAHDPGYEGLIFVGGRVPAGRGGPRR
jgi:lysine decarboxylase